MELIIDLPESKFNLPTLEAKTTCYNYFFQNFMNINKPCIIRNITDGWESSKNWVKDGKPDFEYLTNKYGDCSVTVYKCNEKYFNSQKTFPSSFSDYIKYWKEFNRETQTLNYLKDWHLKLQHPEDNFYNVPVFFASDWLNEFLVDSQEDDYRFVYMGPQNTWLNELFSEKVKIYIHCFRTPFHSDVFSSFSWSANVCGQKRWLFFPPGEENRFRDNLNNLPFDVGPHVEGSNCIEIIQNPGEAVFVPSCWYHQVYNLEDTISINHNWINGCNIHFVWKALRENLLLVKKEIEDCKEMPNFIEHCQVMLKASFGMDYLRFYDMLKYVASKRILALRSKEKITLFNGHIVGVNHMIFDLQAIQQVLSLFSISEEVLRLEHFKNVNPSPVNLSEDLEKSLRGFCK
ncbi:unnamed protein product [Brassicogethes aeneus]|uniref:Jumonji domain-containing protein 4 n=1 Tax=Brassicogethes aeneus TaxID=1431903 RepID=A0A9P0B8H4_BRAAE|nr:unnamed protein product [Brassicogethes aeneus]